MFRKYFISLYFQILKKRLHKMRLRFFMELNDFHILLKTENFWSKICRFIENSIESFSRIMSLIDQIEWVEKYMEKWDIFDSNFYALQLHRDILKIINPIENELTLKLIELKSTKNNPINSSNISSIENINLQSDRINMLINDMENAIEKLKNIIENLNNNIIRYKVHQTI